MPIATFHSSLPLGLRTLFLATRHRSLATALHARRAASAQTAFPSRRAREKTVPEKVTGQLLLAGNFQWESIAVVRTTSH